MTLEVAGRQIQVNQSKRLPRKTVSVSTSLRSKRFQSSYWAKVRTEAEKRLKVPSFPSPSPVIHFFCSCPSFLDEPREETLATQASLNNLQYPTDNFHNEAVSTEIIWQDLWIRDLKTIGITGVKCSIFLPSSLAIIVSWIVGRNKKLIFKFTVSQELDQRARRVASFGGGGGYAGVCFYSRKESTVSVNVIVNPAVGMWNFLLEILSFSVFFGFSILNQIISGQLLHEGKIFSVGYTSHNCMDFLLDLVTEGVSKSYPICTVLSPPASPRNDVHANHTSFSLHFNEWKRFSACHLSTEGLACVKVFCPVRKQENFWSHEQVGVTSCYDLEIITMRAIESNVWWRPSFTPTEDSCRLTQASFSLATLLVLNFAGL